MTRAHAFREYALPALRGKEWCRWDVREGARPWRAPAFREGTVRAESALVTPWWRLCTATVGVHIAIGGMQSQRSISHPLQHSRRKKKTRQPLITHCDQHSSDALAHSEKAGSTYHLNVARNITQINFLFLEQSCSDKQP